MKEKNNKKYTIIISIVLLLLTIGATYAYFALSNGEDAQSGVNVISNTTDSLYFQIEKNLELSLSSSNFSEGMESVSESVWAKAELSPNNKTSEAHDSYNMYFLITENEFDYVTSNKKAEILLKVTDTKGTEVETDDEIINSNIDGLNYITVVDGKGRSHSGYDITKEYGIYTLLSEKEINAYRGIETHNYKIEVVFINYNENQNNNAGKTIKGQIILTKEDLGEYQPTYLNNIEMEKENNSITTTLKLTDGSAEIDKYYFKVEAINENPVAFEEIENKIVKLANVNDNGYVERDSASYTFDAVENKKYNIYAYTIDKLGIKSNVYKESIINNDSVLLKINSVSVKVGSTIKLTVESTSSNINEYCYRLNKAEYICSDSNIQIFDNVNTNTGNSGSVYIIDSDGNKSLEYRIRIPKKETFSDYIKKLYNAQSHEGEKGIYYHDGNGADDDYNYGLYEAGANVVGGTPKYEKSYRYSGTNPDNYVCFGGTCDSSGTSENLYRIIGVFDGQVKLIKATYAKKELLGTSGGWKDDYNYKRSHQSGVFKNDWSKSLLNKYNLNSGYEPNGSVTETYGFLYTIGDYWNNMIVDHTWKVGGNTNKKLRLTKGARNVYNSEIINPSSANSTDGLAEYTNKVGLVYLSDYMYAVAPTKTNKSWSDLMGYSSSGGKVEDFRSVVSQNWLNPSVVEWTISRQIDNAYFAYIIKIGGYFDNLGIDVGASVRPAFYLDPNVTCIDGTGTAKNPYIIDL